MSFKLSDFIAAPSQELLDKAKKSDLLDIADHYGLSNIKTSMLKHEIKNILIQFFVDEEIFDSSATSQILVTQTDLQLRELEIKRQIEMEKLKFEYEERIRAEKAEREERIRLETLEREERMHKQKLEMEEREKEKQRELEREKIELEKEKLEREERLEIEKEKFKFEIEEKERERQFQLRMKEIELNDKSKSKSLPLATSTVFDVTKHIRLVPPFQEKEVDKYFLHFEKVAENLKWPREHWTLLLQSVVIGKAREIYTQLSLEQSSDYDTVKECILKAYELVPEAYRQKFRDCRKEHDQTHVEFARTKEQLFDRWCSSKKVGSDHAKLRQLMLVEEFKRCINSDVKAFLNEREVENLETAARLADDYALTHKASFVNKPYPRKPYNPQSKQITPQSKPYSPQSGPKANPSNPTDNSSPKPKFSSENKGQNPLSQPICNYCKKTGHIISECLALKRKKERENLDSAKPTGLTSLKAKPQSCIQEENPILTRTCKESVSEDSIMEIYEPFLSDGFVSLNSDSAQSTPIKILRDTGASQSLILADTLPFSEKSSSGTSVLIQGVECGFVNVPLHNIYLSSDLVKGPVAVGIRPSLPFKGIHLLLGNDLAGDKVVVNPLLTSTPCVDQPPDPIEQEIPDLYPSCAVTRAMAKKAKLNHGMQDIDLTDTLIGQSFNKEISTSLSPSQSDIQTDPSNPRSGSENDLSPSTSNDQGHDQMSRSQFCKEQHSDSEISPLFERALDEKEISQVPVCYYVKNGIQYKSSAYHPESQGALERFHQTLKNMIRSYCFDTEKDWDEGIHLLLFAVRESVQESLGFSPFELVFGHTVRGPLKLLKEKFLSDDDSSLNLLQYVSDFKNRLSKACDAARSNLKSAQSKMKIRYDENAKDRNFEPGDKVLALLPIPGRPLQARYYGPYTVDKKLSDVNYIVNTPGRRKQKQLCHINMLKKYIDRDSNVISSVNIVNSVPHEQNQMDSEDFNLEKSDPSSSKLQNSDILQNLDQKLSHLDSDKRLELKQLVLEYEHLFPDIPSRTDKIYHDVDIIEGSKPVKQHPYRMSPVKQQYLREEVQYLLDNDFIEPSQSEWSSPCILVPKPDGTFRMCTDYRKVNSVTKTDTFPIPRIDDCIDNIGHAKYVTKFDLLKGFWQIPLTDRAKEISAFVTPDGLYQYKVMPFGMKNSPATFQRLVNSLISNLDGCKAYIDDAIIFSEEWQQHLQTIRTFFDRQT